MNKYLQLKKELEDLIYIRLIHGTFFEKGEVKAFEREYEKLFKKYEPNIHLYATPINTKIFKSTKKEKQEFIDSVFNFLEQNKKKTQIHYQPMLPNIIKHIKTIKKKK